MDGSCSVCISVFSILNTLLDIFLKTFCFNMFVLVC